jgi:hypothetical protein
MYFPANTSKSGATFLWVLGAFASFAVLFLVIQTLGAKKVEIDPRAPERLANTAEIAKAQTDLIAKMGLNDAAKKDAIYTKALEVLQSRKPAVSTQVVPGSPTQLKQAAAAAPAPAPAATPAAPATAPAVPATK